MTLVVARAFSTSLHIVSDTKLSFDHVIHNKPLEHAALKCIILSPDRCVAFAGDSGVAEKGLTPLIASGPLNRDEIRQRLLHWTTNAQAEFLIATAGTDRGIDVVRNAQVEIDQSVAWIGDSKGFAKYQEASLSADECGRKPETESEQIHRMDGAMQAVIDDSEIPSVAGFRIHAAARTGSQTGPFKYQPYTFGSGFQPVSGTTEPTSLLRTVGVAGGSYNFTVLVPTTPGIAAIGIYVLEGRVGVLYYPAKRWSPYVVRDVSFAEFVAVVKADYGLDITGFGF